MADKPNTKKDLTLEEFKKLQKWVLNCTIPMKDMTAFTEWNQSCIKEHNDLRWKKMWNDHMFRKEFKDLLINILVDINQIKSTVKKIEANNKK